MLYHVALAGDWAAAQTAGSYRVSTVDVSLDREGFIHTSWREQLRATADRFYRGVHVPLVLLEIDELLLTSPWRIDPVPGSQHGFPHVYGPINIGAVVRVSPVRALPDGGWDGLPDGA